jgi:hypothetical protein
MKKSQAEATTARSLEEKFDRGEEVLDYFDVRKARVIDPRSKRRLPKQSFPIRRSETTNAPPLSARNRRVIVKRVSAPQLSRRPAHLPAPKWKTASSFFQLFSFSAFQLFSMSAFLLPLPAAIRHPRAGSSVGSHFSISDCQRFSVSRMPECFRASLPPRRRRHARRSFGVQHSSRSGAHVPARKQQASTEILG